jgi:hypothetical protein
MTSNGSGGGAPFAVRYADIIFAQNVCDPAGQNPKNRRVVVLTPDTELATGFPIVAAGITGTLPPVITSDYVLLPYKNPPGTRHPKTGLTKRAAVLCTWVIIVDPSDVLGRSGFAPPSSMSLIQQKAGAAAKVLGGWP